MRYNIPITIVRCQRLIFNKTRILDGLSYKTIEYTVLIFMQFPKTNDWNLQCNSSFIYEQLKWKTVGWKESMLNGQLYFLFVRQLVVGSL